MNYLQLYHYLMESVIVIFFLAMIYFIGKKFDKEIWIKAISDEKGNISSTRIKSLAATFIALFLVIVGTVGIAPVQLQFVLTLLGYAGIEHGAEKVKEVTEKKVEKNGS